MEGEFIIVSLISLAGMVLITQLYQYNWYKKENFKIQKKNMMDLNRLDIRKLEKEMGLKPTKTKAQEKPGPINILGQLAPILKNLDGEQIMDLAERFLPGGDEGPEESGIVAGLLQYAEEHPEIVGKIIGNIPGANKNAEEITGQVS